MQSDFRKIALKLCYFEILDATNCNFVAEFFPTLRVTRAQLPADVFLLNHIINSILGGILVLPDMVDHLLANMTVS